MPELPEVETLRLQLAPILIGKKISAAYIYTPKSFLGPQKNILDTTMTAIERFGKMNVIRFANGFSLVIHLKMTGQLCYVDQKKSAPHFYTYPNQHTRIQFRLNTGEVLFFNDIRKFGWIRVVSQSEKDASLEVVSLKDFIKHLGPDALRVLTKKMLYAVLQTSSRPVKNILLDQSKISGIGNIYANDSLFLAKIHPRMKANTIDSNQSDKLFGTIQKVLTEGIRLKGASRTNFRDIYGRKGKKQDHFFVYEREGYPCFFNCSAVIRRTVLGGRATYYCPNCQNEKFLLK